MARHVVILDGSSSAGRAAPAPSPGPAPRLLSPLASGAVQSRRRRGPRWPIPVLAAASMALALVLQIGRPIPEPTLRVTPPATVTVAGTAPSLPWPAQGQAAVSIPSAGVLVPSGPESPVPIASLTKVMTAYVVLRDHPLTPGTPGPGVTMTAVDVRDDAGDEAGNATSIPVTPGEVLSERQLLDALLVHSANDVADALARWDSGTVASFVAKMNATSRTLGMTETRYTDASGIDVGDVSTAADQLRVADAAMNSPAFAAVVAQPAVVIPGAGLLSNYVPAVGTDGVVGVKSGFTQAAMGCLVLAAERQVAGRTVLVLAALTGQTGGYDPVRPADRTAIALVDAAVGGVGQQTLLSPETTVGTVSVPWATHPASARTTGGVTTLVWPGTQWTSTIVRRTVRMPLHSGDVVATLVLSDGERIFRLPVVATAGFPSPSLHWRLTHS